MSSKHYTKFKCDNCGKKEKVPGWDGGFPSGWTSLYLGRHDDYEYCPECSKRIYLFAMKPGIGHNDDNEVWQIKPADITALAEGVPPEDIFV